MYSLKSFSLFLIVTLNIFFHSFLIVTFLIFFFFTFFIILVFLLENPVLLQQRLLKGQHLIYVEQKNIMRALSRISFLVENSENINASKAHLTEFAEDNELDLPFENLSDFQKFDKCLETDKVFRKAFVSKK